MKIGILQTGRSPETFMDEFGDYDQMFIKMLAGRGFEFETFAVLDNEFPALITDADGWLVTGSRFGAYEDHPWIAPLESLIRAIYAAQIPLIGVCFGHQIIAQALGGKVEKYSGGWSVGRVEYKMQDGTTLPLHAWHQDQIVEKPAQARVLGSTEFCEFAVLAYGNSVLTMQPHPEMNAAFVAALIETRGKGVVPETLLEQATAGLGAPVEQTTVAELFEKHFKQEKQNV